MTAQASAIATVFAEDRASKFGTLGEELDRATIALQRVEDYIARMRGLPASGAPGGPTLIKIVILGASFADGSATVQDGLNRHLGEYLVEMLDRCVVDCRAEYQEAADKLKAEMGLVASVPPARGRGNGRQGDSS